MAPDVKNVEVRNGTVTNFYTGVFTYGSAGPNHRVINIRATSNSWSGINVGGSNVLIENCTAYDNGTGNTAVASLYGICLNGSGIVRGCVSYSNGSQAGDGVDVYGIYASNATISGNASYDNG